MVHPASTSACTDPAKGAAISYDRLEEAARELQQQSASV